MAYVYRHIRLDKNIPFYIGIGSDTDGEYKRAYSIANRNNHWRNIVSNYGYDVEILMDGLSWEQAQDKEVEFIALYKRKIHGGSLCNYTDGGGGSVGLMVSNETKEKQRLKKLGKPGARKWIPQTKATAEKISAANKGKKAWNKDISPSKTTIEKQLKTKEERGVILRGANHPMYGKTHSDDLKAKWRITRKGSIPWNKGKPGYKVKNDSAHRRKIVLQFDMGWNLIKEYESLAQAANETGFRKGSISKAILGLDRMKSHKGFRWRYK